ncbi:MAG: FHA domain-containing protein [Myxococcota bacterium]
MRNQETRELARPVSGGGAKRFLRRFQASLVVLSGPAAGSEHPLDRHSVSIGRGPGVDLAFEDPAMSREHALLELVEDAFRIRDLGSTNGVQINGEAVQVADLKHGDRIQLGEHHFQYVLEEQTQTSTTYALPER